MVESTERIAQIVATECTLGAPADGGLRRGPAREDLTLLVSLFKAAFNKEPDRTPC